MSEKSIDEKLSGLAQDGVISCAQALAFAREQGIAPASVGTRADALGIKIVNCQLGCFGRVKKKRSGQVPL